MKLKQEVDMTSAVKILRQQLLLTQAAFAKEIGISREIVGKYESSQRYPKTSTIKKMLELARKNNIEINIEDFFRIDN
jgi:transcriptional regulator with XRE-family HTH domain